MRHLRLLSTLLLAMMMAVGAKAAAPSFTTIDNITYAYGSTTDGNNTALVVAYSGIAQTVTIPARIQVNSTYYAVKGIAQLVNSTHNYKAFQGNTTLRTINLPATIETIGEKAFYGCFNLRSVVFPGPEKIGELATVPALTTIGNQAFYNCRIAYFGIGSRGYNTPSGFNIPAKVTSIGASAFYNCVMSAASLPANLTTLGASAFSGCTNLASVTLYTKLTTIGTDAFAGCKDGLQVTIKGTSGNTTVPANMFEDNTAIGKLVLYNNITAIGASAFEGCTNLSEVTLNDGLTTIGSTAFKNTSSLRNIDIPASVTSLNDAFSATGSTGLLQYVTVHWTTASAIPTITENTFPNRAHARLYVPEGTTSLYQAKDYWKEFKNIDGRTAVSEVVGTSDIDVSATPVIGGSLTKPSITTDGPARFVIDPQNGWWQKKDGDVWRNIQEGVFTAGTWRFCCQVRIDGTNGTTHVLKEPVTVTVSEKTWSKVAGDNNAFQVYDAYSLLWVNSPEVTIKPSAATPLTVAQARAIMDATGQGTTTAETYYVQGIVKRFEQEGIYNYFYITDPDGTDEIVAYGCKKDGNDLAEGDINVGDKVIISGTLRKQSATNYDIVQPQLEQRHIAINEANFPDYNFRVALSWENIDQDNDGFLSPEEIAAVTELKLDDYGNYIASLKGIEFFTELQHLECPFFRHMTSLDLSKNTKLTYLDCQQGALTSLDISNNTMLTNANCQGNALTSLLIPNTTTLQYFTCYKNNITGAQMEAFVVSLPDVSADANEHVIYLMHKDGNDGNVITLAQVQAATAKGWSIVNSINEPFVGSDVIIFADAAVKAICVDKWDTDGDGELTYAEAAAVTSLADVDFTSSITTFDELQYFTGLTQIPAGAFSNCTSLTHITIPANVTSIGRGAFSRCASLTDLTIPEGVTSIDDYAFQKYTGDVTLPTTLTEIGFLAFQTANSVKVKWQTPPTTFDSSAFGTGASIGATLYVPIGCLNAYRSEPWSRFNTKKEYGNIPFADANVKALCVNKWDTDGDGELSLDEAEAVSSTGLESVFKNNTTITSFNELKYFTGLTEIPQNAFLGCTGLTSITLPSNLTAIGEDAFSGCTALTAIAVPGSVTTIGERAFSSCWNLADVQLEWGLQTIGEYAFSNTSALVNIDIPTTVTTLDNAFSDLDTEHPGNLKAVHVWWTSADQIPAISDNTFPTHANATLYVPISYETVNGQNVEVSTASLYQAKDVWREFGAFDRSIYFNDQKVKEVCLANWDTNHDGELSYTEAEAVTTIAQAFKGNTEIQYFNELQYFTGITDNMGAEAFDGCTSLRSITLPNTLTVVPDKAFRNCTSLTASFFIPISVTRIGDYAFQGCTGFSVGLSSSSNLTHIGAHAFEGTKLGWIYIPANVTEYGDQAFANCANLTSVTVMRTEPIAITTDPFPNRANIRLTVPAHTSEAYAAADYWKDFAPIEESEPQWHIYTDANGVKYQYEPGYNAQLYQFNKKNQETFTVAASITVDGETLPVTAMADGSVNSTSLKELYIPASVTKLKGATFGYIDALTAIHFDSSTPPAVTSQAFEYWRISVTQAYNAWKSQYDVWKMKHEQWVANGSVGTEPVEPAAFVAPTITLYVPAGSKSAYEAADVWKDFPIVEVEGDTDISQLDNVIYIEPTNAPIGGEISLSFKMKNSAPIVGYQFNIELPEGMSVVLDEENQPILAFNEERTSFSRHDLSASRQSDGSWLVLSGSSNVLTYNGNEGEIFTMRVRVADDMALGNYPIVLRDMKLQEADKTRYYEHSRIKATISVSEYTMGDTNGDSVIDIADYVNVAKAILGDAPAGFNRIAADIDGSGIIDITDYVGVATLILNSNNVKAQQKKVVQDIPLGTLQEK